MSGDSDASNSAPLNYDDTVVNDDEPQPGGLQRQNEVLSHQQNSQESSVSGSDESGSFKLFGYSLMTWAIAIILVLIIISIVNGYDCAKQINALAYPPAVPLSVLTSSVSKSPSVSSEGSPSS